MKKLIIIAALSTAPFVSANSADAAKTPKTPEGCTDGAGKYYLRDYVAPLSTEVVSKHISIASFTPGGFERLMDGVNTALLDLDRAELKIRIETKLAAVTDLSGASTDTVAQTRRDMFHSGGEHLAIYLNVVRQVSLDSAMCDHWMMVSKYSKPKECVRFEIK